jgi:hypothetical protein
LFLSFIIFLFTPFLLFSHYNLSVCAIFRDDAPFLKEWIEFHKLQGVEHFYLYNNNSIDDYLLVLQPYIDSKEVTLKQWLYSYETDQTKDWYSIQTRAYTDCIRRHGKSSDWIAFIDTDEFLFCPNGQMLPQFLNDYKEFGGVSANWHLFGTSDVETIPPNFLMIELLTQCSALDHPWNRQIKSIVQPKYVKDCLTPHVFKYKTGYFAVCPDRKELIKFPFSSSCNCHDLIRINHYWTRTKKHFYERKIPLAKLMNKNKTLQSLLLRAQEYNEFTDTTILQFVPALREQMGFSDHPQKNEVNL